MSGWDDTRWLDTSTLRARWLFVTYALEDHGYADAWDGPYSTSEPVDAAINSALEHWGWPALRAEQQNELKRFAERCAALTTEDWQQAPYRALRQNALRQLIAVSPDLQLQ